MMTAETTNAMPQYRAAAVREASCEEVLNWDHIVTRFDNYRIAHKSAWIHSLQASAGGKPVYLIFEKDGDVVGCLPGLISRLGPVRLFGSPLPGWQTNSMGPVFDKGRISCEELMKATVTFLEAKYGIHHIELISASLDRPIMQLLGFRGEAVPTFRAPLFPGDEERALRQFKDSARRNVRRAVRLGLQPKFEEEEGFVDEAYDQITEVFARGGHVVPFSRKRVYDFFRHMKASKNLVAISVYMPDGKVNIATGMFIIEGEELFLWQWAHRTRYRWYRPTELMTWTVMRKAMEAGCRTFDLMGGGEFKAKFGAQRDLNQYRWVRSRYKWLTQIRDLVEKCYRWQQTVRGYVAKWRLPELPDEAHASGLLRPGGDSEADERR